MPVQPNILPALSSTALQVAGPQGNNNAVSVRQSHANQMWSIKFILATNYTLTYNASVQDVPMDTILYNTYKSPQSPTYTLKPTIRTTFGYGGLNLVLSQFGSYLFIGHMIADVDSGIYLYPYVYKNGSQLAAGPMPAATNTLGTFSYEVVAEAQCNPGDVINFTFRSNSSATETCYGGEGRTSFLCRYMGLS